MSELKGYGFSFREDGSIEGYGQKIEELKYSLTENEFDKVFEKIEEYLDTTYEKIPEVEMYGNKVLKVSDNVFYLKRGEIYCLEDKRFLVLGGAMSDDKAWRKPHESWWKQEEWSEGEKESCFSKIKENKKFDYVLSHTGPSKGIALTDDFFCNEENLKLLQRDSNVVFNDKIDSVIRYKKWFFGHWHSDWGYEHYNESKYVPMYHLGIIIK